MIHIDIYTYIHRSTYVEIEYSVYMYIYVYDYISHVILHDIYIYILNYYLDIYWIRFCLFINSSHPSPFTTWRYLSCVPVSFVSR